MSGRWAASFIHALLACVLMSGAASATEFFVSTTGSDQNPGTQDKPWGSFVLVSDAVSAGDTVTVRGGTYRPAANTYFYKNGTAAAPITFRAFAGETVLLDGANLPANTALIYISANYFVMQDFELLNSKQNGISIDSGQHAGAGLVTVRNCKIHNSFLSGIAITGGHDVTIDSCTIFNNVATNNVHGKPWTAALYAQDCNNVQFTRNSIFDNQGEGLIFLRSDNCRAANNTVHDNFSVNVYLDNARNCAIDSNFIFTQGDSAYFNDGGPAAALQHANESYNGVDAPNYSSDNRITNNVVVVLNNNAGFLYSNFNGRGGGLKNFLFAHNTIYRKVSGADPASLAELIHIDPGIPQANVNAQFSDNIFVTESGGKLSALLSPPSGVSFDHNLFFGGEMGQALQTGDQFSDPHFAAPGGYAASGYIPLAGSPAFGAGVTIPGITLDFNGAARGASADIGAFVAGSVPPTTTGGGPLNFTSPVSVNPNPAQAGEAVVLNAAAAGSGTLTYTWSLGDGTSMSGASIVKIYDTPGVYAGSVSVSNGSASSTQTFQVTVLGSPFLSSNVVLKLSSHPGSDALQVSGTLALQNVLQLSGAGAVFSLGDFSRALSLNARGASSDRSFKLNARFSKGALLSPMVRFTFAVRRQSLAASFPNLDSSSGLHSFNTTMSLSLGGYYFSGVQTVNYSIR